jgi:hypothetical protein
MPVPVSTTEPADVPDPSVPAAGPTGSRLQSTCAALEPVNASSGRAMLMVVA